MKIILSNQFKKDLKLAKKGKYDLKHLENVVNKLACNEKLDAKYRDHILTGNY